MELFSVFLIIAKVVNFSWKNGDVSRNRDVPFDLYFFGSSLDKV